MRIDAGSGFQGETNNNNQDQGPDDRPVAVNDANTLGAQAQLVAGNVMANDSAGADGAAVSALTSNNTGSSDSRADGSGNLQVNGEFGRLTVNSDGSYRYTRTTTQDNVTDLFTYKLTDRDGDDANATLAIRILDDMVTVAATPSGSSPAPTAPSPCRPASASTTSASSAATWWLPSPMERSW